MGSLLPGGWDELRARNHGLAIRARAILCEVLGITTPAPESMICSLATVPLPPGPPGLALPTLAIDPIMGVLFERYRIEVLASVWPESPGRVLRVSAQIYNEESQYVRLGKALKEILSAA